MRAVFLSDAHLWNERDEGYRRLLRFLGEIRGRIDHLVVAGDLFDFWFCDEENLYPEFRAMVEALAELKDSGAGVSLIEGNHDFFLEPALAGRGIKVYRDEAIFTLDGLNIYVAHGDQADGGNRPYLLLRKILRSDLFFTLQKWLPSPFLWRLARVSSSSSRKYRKANPRAMVSTMCAFGRKKIAGGMDGVILGHSHQPMLKELNGGTRQGVLGLLGDWIDHYSYLVVRDGRFFLEYYRDGRMSSDSVLK